MIEGELRTAVRILSRRGLTFSIPPQVRLLRWARRRLNSKRRSQSWQSSSSRTRCSGTIRNGSVETMLARSPPSAPVSHVCLSSLGIKIGYSSTFRLDSIRLRTRRRAPSRPTRSSSRTWFSSTTAGPSLPTVRSPSPDTARMAKRTGRSSRRSLRKRSSNGLSRKAPAPRRERRSSSARSNWAWRTRDPGRDN